MSVFEPCMDRYLNHPFTEYRYLYLNNSLILLCIDIWIAPMLSIGTGIWISHVSSNDICITPLLYIDTQSFSKMRPHSSKIVSHTFFRF